MTIEQMIEINPRLQDALSELRGLIAERFPGTDFSVAPGDDPEGVYLTATVDLDDPDAVVDVVIERLLTMQIEEALPLFVFPVRTPARIAAMRRARAPRRPTAAASSR